VPNELTPLLRYWMETTAVQLADEFRGVFSRETVTRYVEDSYEQIGDRLTVGPNFLPVIVERFAREQLGAVAQADGRIEKPLPGVLFVCEHNGGRSQIAACFAHHLSNGWVAVRSAGSHPDERIDPVVVQAMDEIGLDVSAEFPKSLTDAVVCAADVVVTLRCGDAFAVYPGKRYQDWPILDPADQPLEVVRRIRYEIYHHVWELIETLVPAVNLAQLQRPSMGTT
jgi:arsenate reductase (thioredoxin)